MASADRAAVTAKRSPPGSPQTLGDVVGQWLARLQAEGSLKPQTTSEYERAIRPLLRSFESASIHNLTPSELSAMLSAVYSGKPDRWRQALVVMRGALTDAVQAGIVDRNVARELRPPRKKRKPVRALNEEHVAMLINELRTPVVDPTSNAVVDRVDNQFSDAALLQFSTGARVGEICALRWNDITFEDNSVVVRFRATVISRSGPARIQEEPKTTSSNRSLRVKSPAVVQMLRRRRADQTHDELVFPGDRGGILSPHTVQARWRKARAALGVDASWITPHVARRTLVTARAEQGWSFEEIARAVGHSDPGTSRRIYTEYRPSIIDLDDK